MEKLLLVNGIKPTRNRVAVAELLSEQDHPVTAPEILEMLQQRISINKVTLYRILDLFEDHNLVLKHRADDRTFRYCLKEAERTAHCHFLCTECGGMSCIVPEDVGIDSDSIVSATHHISNVEIRIDGVCENCGK